jgi:ABC-type amino acid transport system permease subunit
LDSALATLFRRLREEPLFKTALALLALAIVMAAALTALNDVGLISFTFMAANWTFLIGPAETALFATIVSYCIGFTFAIPMGVVRAFGPGILRRRDTSAWLFTPIYGFISGYTEAIRGTPVFVQILLIDGLVTAAVPKLPAVSLWAGIIALTINTAGYQTEVFRAGFQSVGQGQLEAAKSIGMHKFQAFRYISLPQGLRLITLPLVNEWIALFKASSLLWGIAVGELMWATNYIGVNLGHPIEGFLMGSFFYLVIIIPLSRTVSYLERKKRIPGLGVSEPSRARFLGVRRAVTPIS